MSVTKAAFFALLLLAPFFLASLLLLPPPAGSDRTPETLRGRRLDSGVVHIERPALERFFPFHAAASDHCVTWEEVEDLSGALRQLLNSGVRVFPRNGFLLGIVRHGGFLPHEHVDADLGIVYDDIARLPLSAGRDERRPAARVPGFTLLPKAAETYWKNWRGFDPVTREPYKFLGVNIHVHGTSATKVRHLQANSVYAYGDTGNYFFPWLTSRKNHEARLADAIRYNEEGGGDTRVLDTDEWLDASNYRDEAQMANVFDTDLTCFVEKQFYFTTIPVPCDYDAILTSFYGKDWGRVESRGEIAQDNGMETKHANVRVSEEANNAVLRGGPRPLCMD